MQLIQIIERCQGINHDRCDEDYQNEHFNENDRPLNGVPFSAAEVVEVDVDVNGFDNSPNPWITPK